MNDQFDFVKRACSGILIADFSVSKPSYEAQLPKGMSAAIVAKIAAKTGEGKVATPITKIPLFGPFQKEFGETVLRPLGQFRNNLIYTRLEIDGGRMFTVAEFPEAYPAIEAEAEKIQAAIAEVGDERLSAWCEAGISSAIRTYEGVFPGVENWVRDKLPSARFRPEPQQRLKRSLRRQERRLSLLFANSLIWLPSNWVRASDTMKACLRTSRLRLKLCLSSLRFSTLTHD